MTDPAEPRGDLVPGVMRCAKCEFLLVRTTLYVCSGTTGSGDSKTEPCPNGCGPLWPVTWKQWAEDAQATAERFFEEAKAEREKAERLRARVAELESRLEARDECGELLSESADGIACREETIRLLDARVKKLEREIERLQTLVDKGIESVRSGRRFYFKVLGQPQNTPLAIVFNKILEELEGRNGGG